MASRLRSGEESILGCRLIEDSLACWRRTTVLDRFGKISSGPRQFNKGLTVLVCIGPGKEQYPQCLLLHFVVP